MEIQLKKCPFCGGEAVLEPYKARKGYEASIQCNGGCLLYMTTITYDTQEEAVEKVVNRWNMRMNEWVDAKNKFPEEYKSVIVYTTKKQITVAIFNGEDWMKEDDEIIAQWNIGEVTHWMPLPSPPLTNKNKYAIM